MYPYILHIVLDTGGTRCMVECPQCLGLQLFCSLLPSGSIAPPPDTTTPFLARYLLIKIWLPGNGLQIQIYKCMHTQSTTYLLKHTHAHTRICKHACMHIRMHTHTHTHQIEVLAGLTEEEALHSVLLRFSHHIMESSIATPMYRKRGLYYKQSQDNAMNVW